MGLHFSFSETINKSSEYFGPSWKDKELKKFNETINDSRFGFFKLTEHENLLKETKDVYKKFKNKKTFVHVGIGGSSLGPEMLIYALKKNETNFVFINNIDSEEIASQLKNIEIADSVFFIVSKSGGTAETMSAFSIIANLLREKNIADSDFKNHFVFCTDPVKSDLLDLSKNMGIETLQIPSNIGGRYSVFTPAGLLPALFAGIDIDKLFSGANSFKKSLLAEKNNPLLDSLSAVISLKNESNVTQTVLMPYSSKLKYLSSWFVQLWAESLGKAKSKDGRVVNTGLTPLSAYGATDQHSQMQLFMEGPYDKCVILIEVKKMRSDFKLKNNFNIPSLNKLSPYTLNQLMKAELEGTKKALTDNKRPFISIEMSENSEENLSALILFLESLTVITGNALGIDPFDQPGVELGKKYAYEWLQNQ